MGTTRTTRTTLRELNGFDETPASLSDATLILVDYQNTYTRGVMELDGWRAALDSAAALLARAREAGAKVVHVVNDGGEGTPYDIRAEIGAIHPSVAPVEGEPVVVKKAPNAFVDTDLGAHVDAAGHKDVVVAGFMTHMCVTFTAEGAFLRGNRPTVVADACATRPLRTVVADVSAEQLHRSALATIADLYGVVVASGADLN
ncbi:isochorismatase family protein [Streptomyces sp. Je 1-79]|uniref:isochorismatase family protein n=1 Tax=Streptomyces sp. Je 1-79 TaxID=2943847 RepID=UPI0021A8C1BE|nr:isochorismatase family protein [Streptomyces sp. Je 1-79]MCT4356867.1 isochorismatase family protein [Streptomyces sp. Je 1-79]